MVAPLLCGATLFACKKKGGGLHPIAVGVVLRYLTSKCISRAVQAQAIGILSPLQLGVGVPVGCEAIVHSVDHVLEDPGIQPDARWTLLVDFSNVFNSVSREVLFREVRARLPSMSAWIECCYSPQPLLTLGSSTIYSCCGVQQGDPLGPLGFALALHPIIEKVQEKLPGLLINAWYLDDDTLCGSPRDLQKALDIIEEDGSACGLHLNRAKSLLFVPAVASMSLSSLPSEIPITRKGFGLLGTPMGSVLTRNESVLQRVEKIRSILEILQDSQMEATLLRSCLSLPKVVFALCTCPPVHISHALQTFDHIMLEALFDLAGGPLSNWAWKKASFPSSLGGLGIRWASLHAPAAYISSLDQCSALVTEILRGSLSCLAEAASRPEWLTIQEIDVPLRQHSLCRSVDIASYHHLLSEAPDSRCRALALSSAISHAGDWLNVVPSSTLGLHLHDLEFRLCL